ncbi:MAG: cysteine desulfurase [Proteobacteria bacterium]|nr:cysteine desulfurase [Pseudomonadota bacterium]
MTTVALKTAPDATNYPFDVDRIRADFPILARPVHGKPLAFLDSGASAQKPQAVLDAIQRAYSETYANVHRGAYYLSQAATDGYEGARKRVADYINAASADEIIFTRNVTSAINLVASSYGAKFLQAGDEIILSQMEHHANIVPWQMLRDRIGIEIKVAPIDDRGNFLLDEYEKLLSPKTKLVAITQVSNVLGTIVPLDDVIRLAHAQGAHVLVDGAQGIVHSRVDVQALDADFYGFTGHKLYGPSGIGALYGKMELLKQMPPYEGGGDMIELVTFEKTTYREPPARFEAGTPPIVQAIGLHAAIDYVDAVGIENVAAHEATLLEYATDRLSEYSDITIIGQADNKAGIISFVMDGAHAHDIGTIVDAEGVAIRTGHHCAQPLMDRFDLAATARASFGMYNTRADVDALLAALDKVRDIFG